MKNYTPRRKLPLTYANWAYMIVGLGVILFGFCLFVIGIRQQEGWNAAQTAPTTEVSGTIRYVHVPLHAHRDDLFLKEYDHTFVLWTDRYDHYDHAPLLLDEDRDAGTEVVFTVPVDQWESESKVVEVYAITKNGEPVLTKEEFLRKQTENSIDVSWIGVGFVLLGIVGILVGVFMREKPKYYSVFSQY